MDQLSEEVRQESPWTMMFADDIVICSESREQVEENLERWRFVLERRGIKVSRSKTEYMCVNEREGSGTVRLQGEEVKKVQEFKYLESTVQSNGECGKEVIRRNMTGVWLASTAWAVHSSIVTLPGIQTVGTVLGFTDMTRPISLLSPYVHQLFTNMQEERLKMQLIQPDTDVSPLENPCPDCWSLSPVNVSIVETELVQRTAFSVYSAVYSVAHALHNMLGCNTNVCTEDYKKENIYPWQLLPWVQKVSMKLNGAEIKFDTEGNPSIGYDLLAWVFQNNTVSFKNIGTFVQNLTIDKKLIKWHTRNNTIPTSRCSSDCLSGQVRIVKGFYSCCFDCSDCLEGTYQNRTDDIQCTKCPPRQWSMFRSTSCVFPTYEYLAWSSFESVALILAGLLLLSCQAAIGFLFFQHRGTPLLKALGGPLCVLGLLSLMGSCISLVLYLGQPNDVICRIQILLYMMFPTVALSTLLAISMQIVYVCEFPEKALQNMENMQGLGSWSLVLACCGVQSGLVGWFILEGPSLTKWVDSLEVNFVKRFLPCPVEPILNFGLMLGFNGLLALICFMCTFMAPKPVRQYNFARDITIASLIYCVIWVIFIPIYAGLGDKEKTIAQVVFTLISNTALTVSYYLPKCHLLVKEPDLNKNEYFASILEGIPPIPPEEPPPDQNKQDPKKDNKEDNKDGDKNENKEESKEETEAEMSKLQRQFRIMEGDRQAYSVQSQELTRKQRLEIEKLLKEHEELQKNLCVSESQSRKQADTHYTQQLRALLNRRDELDEQLERERLSQAELEREIQYIQKKLEELRKGDVGTFHRQKSQVLHIQKATRTLENKLDRALIRFNQQLAKNSQLREELETLRVERVRFQQLHHKLDKELQEIRREIGDVISMSTAAYDARVEAQTKMTMMKEKAVKDLAQYNAEMKELERLIAHEQRLKDFMATKCNERTELDDALSHRHVDDDKGSEVKQEVMADLFNYGNLFQ
ncbi:hypothetical protein QTP86_006369 [Hemibagrus guttatus]|nr:hypothetical protein QTP86_006369 [Hemibagrus guttatus]